MTVGSYEERTGDLELPKVEGDPKVFVLAGNGTGTAVFRKLQRDGIPFAAGILWKMTWIIRQRKHWHPK